MWEPFRKEPGEECWGGVAERRSARQKEQSVLPMLLPTDGM
jgi:hypothetical protein